MYVHEMKGSWWQAKKSNGDIGMIPSNYVSFTAADQTIVHYLYIYYYYYYFAAIQ